MTTPPKTPVVGSPPKTPLAGTDNDAEIRRLAADVIAGAQLMSFEYERLVNPCSEATSLRMRFATCTFFLQRLDQTDRLSLWNVKNLARCAGRGAAWVKAYGGSYITPIPGEGGTLGASPATVAPIDGGRAQDELAAIDEIIDKNINDFAANAAVAADYARTPYAPLFKMLSKESAIRSHLDFTAREIRRMGPLDEMVQKWQRLGSDLFAVRGEMNNYINKQQAPTVRATVTGKTIYNGAKPFNRLTKGVPPFAWLAIMAVLFFGSKVLGKPEEELDQPAEVARSLEAPQKKDRGLFAW